MCGLKSRFTFSNRNSRIRSKNYISSKCVNREWRPINGLWMMMPGSLALVWCIPLSPATWNCYFSFSAPKKAKNNFFLFFSAPGKVTDNFSFLISPSKIWWKNHLIQRIGGLHKTMSTSIIVAEPIISYLLYVFISFNSSKSMLNVFKLDFKWSPHVDTTICAIKVCW